MKNAKLNLFALPSQTAILFWLNVATLLGAITFGTGGAAPVPTRWLVPVFVLLSLWNFLSRPDRDLRRAGLYPIDEQFPLLQDAVERHSRQIGLRKAPAILLSMENRKLHVMGSFRRWFIVIGKEDVQALENLLCDSENSDIADMKILHELYHFKNGDYWQLGLLSQLFNTTFSLMLWFMLFFGGWVFLLALASHSFLQLSPSSIVEQMPPEIRPAIEQLFLSTFPSSAEMDALRSKVAEINFLDVASFIFNISLPFMFITAILWYFYLPLFWRMREFYADAGVVQTLGTVRPFWKVLLNVPVEIESESQVIKRTNLPVARMIFYAWGEITGFLSERRRFSPDGRTDALLAPQKVFYTWKQIALYLGGLALILEVFLATPLALPLIGQNPLHFATVVIFGALTYFLLPQMFLGQSNWRDALRIILVINLVRLAWLALTLFVLWGSYFLVPSLLSEVLRSAIYSTARYAGNAPFEIDLLEFLLKASIVNLAQVPIILIVQIVAVLVLVLLFRRITTWYSFFATSDVFKRTLFWLTSAIASILMLIVLPISTALLTGNISVLLEPMMVFQICLGTIILFGVAVWFVVQNRRHTNGITGCKQHGLMVEPLQTRCSSCGNALFPWLWTEYQDE